MRHRVLIAALALTTLGVGAALADDDCEAPMADWQPRDAVKQMAESKGWTVRRIKIDDGCYEITGRDAKGDDIEAKVHPATLAIVEMESEGGDDDDDEDDDEDGDEDGNAGNSSLVAPDSQSAAPLTSPAPRNPLLNGNSPPSAVVQ
ncbi:MAG: PepSY domain-containing protein [Dongiaceae bacterium]